MTICARTSLNTCSRLSLSFSLLIFHRDTERHAIEKVEGYRSRERGSVTARQVLRVFSHCQCVFWSFRVLGIREFRLHSHFSYAFHRETSSKRQRFRLINYRERIFSSYSYNGASIFSNIFKQDNWRKRELQ